jgi:hypothetical protein
LGILKLVICKQLPIFFDISNANFVSMLICATCHRNNAPWAKQCTSCKSSLLESPQRLSTDSLPEPLLEPVTVIQVWDPLVPPAAIVASAAVSNADNDWRPTDEIVNSVDLSETPTIRSVTMLKGGNLSPLTLPAAGVGRFDSHPILSGSKDRFQDYDHDVEATRANPWVKRGVLILGVLGIVVAGALAIHYIHSTTPLIASVPEIFKSRSMPSEPFALSGTAASKNDKTFVPNSSGKLIGSRPTETVEQELPNDSTTVDATNRALLSGGADPTNAAVKQPESDKPPVFVMSASEPIAAKPLAGKIEVATPQATVKPVKTVSSLSTPPKQAKPIAPKAETRQGSYPVLVPVPSGKNTTIASTSDISGRGTAAEAVSDMPAAISVPARLQTLQSSECANSAFLGKVFCEERSRVNFCKNRWNEHQDCQLGNKLDP